MEHIEKERVSWEHFVQDYFKWNDKWWVPILMHTNSSREGRDQLWRRVDPKQHLEHVDQAFSSHLSRGKDLKSDPPFYPHYLSFWVEKKYERIFEHVYSNCLILLEAIPIKNTITSFNGHSPIILYYNNTISFPFWCKWPNGFQKREVKKTLLL